MRPLKDQAHLNVADKDMAGAFCILAGFYDATTIDTHGACSSNA